MTAEAAAHGPSRAAVPRAGPPAGRARRAASGAEYRPEERRTPEPERAAAHSGKHSDDRQQHQDQQQRGNKAAAVAALSAIIALRTHIVRFGYKAAIIPNTVLRRNAQVVVIRNFLKGGLEEFSRARVVASGGKIRLQIIVVHLLKRAGGEYALNAKARQYVILAFLNGHQQQQAVVLLGRTDAPGIKHLARVIVNIRTADAVERRHDDLCAARLVEPHVAEIDLALGGLGKHVRRIQIVKIVAGFDHSRRGQRRSAAKRQQDRQCQGQESFH